MNKSQRYSLLLCCILFVLGGCKRKTRLPDLRETYASQHTKPFGGNIAFGILQNSFPSNYVQQTKLPFEKGLMSSPDTASLYFCLARNFYLSAGNAEMILDYVSRGNTFFLAAANIDSSLLEKMNCKVKTAFEFELKETYVRLIEDADTTKARYSYFYLPFTSSFSEIKEGNSRIVGYNADDQPNCIVYFLGKGKIFLHTDPRAFSNYFLLKNNNYLYMQDLLQLVNQSPEHIYWDDYYYRKSNSGSGFSTLDALLKFPPLASAFWLSLFLLLLFILFELKRRQRIIKQISPNVNSSVAFTETVARLYLQKNDNKNIADKMITYFNEYIRSNYFLHVNAGSDEFIKTLSRKSGVSLESTTALYRAINHANQNEKLDDYQLLSLNDQIQQFYKKRK
ncbi:MAG: hypothetical protein QM737_02190 [Ferruginibacter sp.]